MNKPMNKFKQAILLLRQIEFEHGHPDFIEDLVSRRMSGHIQASYPKLTNSQLNFLDKIGLDYRYRADIHEWEVDLK
jgi:hypothetical protein